jgi:hypothetical protein
LTSWLDRIARAAVSLPVSISQAAHDAAASRILEFCLRMRAVAKGLVL